MNKRALAFAASMLACLLVAWLGGYDFDRRAPDVAFGALFMICISAWVSACPLFDD